MTLHPSPDGRVLVLTGPTLEQEKVPFQIFVADPGRGWSLQLRAILEDVKDDKGERAKAEAILPLDQEGRRVLVLYDGLPNGGPREFELPK